MLGECGTNKAMPAKQSLQPIGPARLEELALSYVSRFATSQAKLKTYLKRKLRERGWEGDSEPPIEALTERLAGLGYVDDRAFALSKARSLSARGYGSRRVRQALAQAGIGEEQGRDAEEFAAGEAFEAALRFARRRSFGPFAAAELDPKARERALAAMIRAGHGLALSKAILKMRPGEEADGEALSNLS